MRAPASFGVFLQDPAGRFGLAPMGQFLERDVAGSLQAAALSFGGEAEGSAVRLFLECVKTGESASQKLSGGNCFDWLLSNPERTKLFESHARAIRVKSA